MEGGMGAGGYGWWEGGSACETFKQSLVMSQIVDPFTWRDGWQAH